MKRIGILALQGDFEAHARAFSEIGAEPVEVRSEADLQGLDGLVIPGGESTTMLKLIEIEALAGPLRAFGSGKPVFGTCAGAILLASEVVNPPQASLELVDITVERNAYGRQLDSRVARIRTAAGLNGHFRGSPPPGRMNAPPRRGGVPAEAHSPECGDELQGGELEAVFIRAPIIRRVGAGVKVLARYREDPVLVEQGRHLVATFHPELSNGRGVQRLFLDKVESEG